MATIQGIYLALFGRPADPAGLEFFNEATQTGANLTAIGDLAATNEYQDRFEGQTDTQIINAIYQSLFGRDADAGGLGFFLAAMADGTYDINNIAIAILDGARDSDLATLNAKLSAANLFTANLDLDTEVAAYAGNDAAAVGRTFIADVDANDPGTQAEADAAIASLLTDGGQEPGNGNGPGGGGGVGTPDTTSPEVDIEAVYNEEDGSQSLTFSFSEVVISFTAQDIVASYGLITNFQRVDARTFTATFQQTEEGVGAVVVDQGSYTDRAGNEGGGSRYAFTNSPVILWDSEDKLLGTFDSIQDGIDAAGRYESARGFYITTNNDGEAFNEGDIELNVDGLTINGFDETINGGIYITGDGSSVRGFTVTGTLDGSGAEGATILVQANDVTIEGTAIYSNEEDARAGIISANGVTGLVINDNVISDFNGNFGVAVYLNPTDENSGNVVTGNQFENNNFGLVFENGPSASDVSGNTFTSTDVEDIEVVLRGASSFLDLSDVIVGNTHDGAAQDVFVYAEHGANVIGTSGNDRFEDFGAGSNDTFDGGLGADEVVGGLGNNTLISSLDSDTYLATGTGESIDFRLSDTAHSGFGLDVTTIEYDGQLLGGDARMQLDIILSGEDFRDAGAAIVMSEGAVISFGIGRAGDANQQAERDFFMVRENDYIQSSPGQTPSGNQTLVVYAVIDQEKDEYQVYFDANGNGDLDVGDAQIHIVGLNSFDVSFADRSLAG